MAETKKLSRQQEKMFFMKKVYSCYLGLALLGGMVNVPLVNAQTFTEQSSLLLPGSSSYIDWGDFDNDGDLDVAISKPAGGTAFSIWKNLGSGTFSEHATYPVANVQTVRSQWADLNNDGLLDVLAAGNIGNSGLAKIYTNSSNGTFTETSLTVQGNMFVESAAIGDYDNDGDMDLLLSGHVNGVGKRTRLLRNEGDLNFTFVSNAGFPDVSDGNLAWKDVDNDGDLDVFISGAKDFYQTDILSAIYINNGDHTFSALTTLGPANSGILFASWGDYDNDGYQDLLISGKNTSTNVYFNKVYRNNSNKTFTEQTNIVLADIYAGQSDWIDFNNDGSLDIALIGNKVSRLYSNNQNYTFSEHTGFPSLAFDVYRGGRWADYDNDGDMDLAVVGYANGGTSRIFKNNSLLKNTGSVAPSGLTASSPNGRDVVFKWTVAADAQTPQSGLTYNISLYNSAEGRWIHWPAAFELSGKRLLAKAGPVQYSTAGYTIKDLPSGTYKWSVQAIDAGLMGGKFAPDLTFTHINLDAISLHVGNGMLGNTTTGIQYSINSTNGVNGTWTSCLNTTTPVALGNGGFAVWVRETANTSNYRKVADVATRAAAPVYTINFRLERTYEWVPATVEYSTNSSFSPATNGNNGWLTVLPGKDLYFRTKATATHLASQTFMLLVPARPATPAYTIDFAAETTAEALKTNDFYSKNADMTVASGGGNSKIKLIPGETLYFKSLYSSTSFASEGTQMLVMPARPAKPAFTLNYLAETTNEAVPATVSYSATLNMANATAGTGVKLSIVPGQNLYFAVTATASSFRSESFLLEIPARPATPSFTINYNTETTHQVVPATVNYSTSQSMDFPTAGEGRTLLLEPGYNLYFAVPASVSSFSSNVFSLNVPARPATPAFTIDYFAETTVQTATTTHEYSKNADLSGAVSGTGAKIALNPGSEFYYLYLRKKAGSSNFASAIQKLLVKDRAFTPSYEIDYKTESTTTFISTYDEYAYSADMSGAVTGTLTAKAPVIPGQTLYIRGKATTQRFASVPLQLIAPARPSAPAYGIDFVNETIDRVIPEHHEFGYSSNLSDAERGWDEKIALTPGTNLYIRAIATPTSFKSEVKTLTVPARPATPAYTIDYTNETTKQLVPNTDEYSVNADMSLAHSGTGGNLVLTPGQKLYFRKKASASNFISAVQTLTIPARPAAPVYTINFAQEKTIEVVPATTEYANNANMFNPGSGVGTHLVLTPGQTLYFRQKASTNSFRSGTTSLAIPGRPASPVYSIDYEAEATDEEVPASHEYTGNADMSNARIGTGAVVTVIPGQPLYLRVKATATSFASAKRTLNVPARPAAPAYHINYVLEQTREAVPATVDYASTDDMEVAAAGTDEPLMLVPGETIYFRVRASYLNFKSDVSILSIPARPAAPVYSIDYVLEKTVEAVATSDEYATVPAMTESLDGDGAPVAVVPGTNLFFRTRATENKFSSEIGNLLVAPRPEFSPGYSIDYINETTSEAVPAIHEYATDSDMKGATPGSGEKISLTPGQSLHFRAKATSNSFASSVYSLEVADRPDAPDHAVISDKDDTFGWTSNSLFTSAEAYEYSINGGSSWSVCASNPQKIGHFDLAAAEVQVRIKATNTNFSSEALISGEAFTRALGLQSFTQAGLLLYPNPATDKLFLDALPEQAVLAIYSVDGKLVKSYHLHQGNNQIDISEMRQGAYILKIKGNKLNAQIRLLKQ
ncbi:regulatory P domain of subtilisin-like proprotein convertases [Flammeovirgaceae bacterium 311]|nr:regulatory P domain of subtilisin-like proprotein convertases [Flammeovirgaceae bacterium 311]